MAEDNKNTDKQCTIQNVILSDSEIELKDMQVWKHKKSGENVQIHSYNSNEKEVILLTWGLMIVQENEFRDKFTFVSHSR